MSEQLLKLSPDRDLQCYFLTPSAIAAMSRASNNGFLLSGKWRQQFDWAVVEWNRDNVFEHPALRCLPDGDLSGLQLSYLEQRLNCIPMESNLFPVVSWNKLRIWATDQSGKELTYYVDLLSHATAVGSDYVNASGTMTLIASPGVGMRAGLAFLEEHYYYTVTASDGLIDIAAGIAADINALSQTCTATSSGPNVTVIWNPKSQTPPFNLHGANGNRITMYGFEQAGGQVWQDPVASFHGGAFPLSYQVNLDFSNLQGTTDPQNPSTLQPIPTNNIRKIRWTWAADLQPQSFDQIEFQVSVSNWTVSGAGRTYSVAGPGSRRIEDTDSAVMYTNGWTMSIGNYSAGRIHSTSQKNASCTVKYRHPDQHHLYLGTRYLSPGSLIEVAIDGDPAQTFSLDIPGEDILVRLPLGTVHGGAHTIVLTNLGNASYVDTSSFYFDFLEIAFPTTNLPQFQAAPQLALATDWDTYHAQSLPAERTAWMINKLGFTGRLNHYVGALWFYELVRTGTQYASVTIALSAVGNTGGVVVLDIGLPGEQPTSISHLILPDDTPQTVASAFTCLINLGSNLVWADATGNQLKVTARTMGVLGNDITVSLDPTSTGYALNPSASTLGGGVDGVAYGLDPNDPLQNTFMAAGQFWKTDLNATPRINRAARDWHRAYFTALKGYGIDSVAAFSTELGNGDSSVSAGIAQRYPDGSPVILNTPAIQTNFSPASLAYWVQLYLDMATLQNAAGMTPYLQSGEVQWWYFPKQAWNSTTQSYVDANVGMTFYDDYTKQQFQTHYGTPMRVILENTADVTQYSNESEFLPKLIGSYTAAIRNALRSQFPGCRYEVLYPTDTNDTSLNQVVNFPDEDWTPANLNCLKTESSPLHTIGTLIRASIRSV